jgi:hypothetical protein
MSGSPFRTGKISGPKAEIVGKFPMEVLEPFQAVELISAISMNTFCKQAVILNWADYHSRSNEKTAYLTL